MARKVREPKLLPPIPPGEILMEEFMKPLGISINALARDIHVPPNRVSEIVNGKRGITADTALRLSQVSWHKCRVVVFGVAGTAPGCFASRGQRRSGADRRIAEEQPIELYVTV